MSFIVMQLVYLSIQGENQWGWPQGSAFPLSKRPLLNQRHDTYMAGLFGILMIKMSVKISTQRHTLLSCKANKDQIYSKLF